MEKRKSCHLFPKVVIDLPFEGREVEGSRKYRRWESATLSEKKIEHLTLVNTISSILESFLTYFELHFSK